MRPLRNIAVTAGAVASLGLAGAASAGAAVAHPRYIDNCSGSITTHGHGEIFTASKIQGVGTNCNTAHDVVTALFDRELLSPSGYSCAEASYGPKGCTVDGWRCSELQGDPNRSQTPMSCVYGNRNVWFNLTERSTAE